MRDMATQYMAKRRDFGLFCVALSYNLPALVHRSFEPGSLVSYSTKVHQFHGWPLTSDGTSLAQFDTGMVCGAQIVSSMSACDIAAPTTSEISVSLGDHPALTCVAYMWAGRRRWHPTRRNLK